MSKGAKLEEEWLQTGMKYPASQSKSLLEMEVANYCEGLDPSYNTLGFENAEVLYGAGGKCMQPSIDTHKDRNLYTIKKRIYFTT